MPVQPATATHPAQPAQPSAPAAPATPAPAPTLNLVVPMAPSQPAPPAANVPAAKLQPPSVCRAPDFKESMYTKERPPAGYFSADKLQPGEVVLTFDDGPDGHTPQILDLLKQHGAKATFFVCGHAITGKNFTIIKRMLDEGHIVANHTLKHVIGLPKYSEATIEREYVMNQAIVDIALTSQTPEEFEQRKAAVLAGKEPMPTEHPYKMVLTRPTGGDPYIHSRWGAELRARYSRVLQRNDLYTILWNAESQDSNGQLSKAQRQDPVLMSQAVTKYLKAGGLADREGALILMHDRIPVGAVKIILETLDANQSRGQHVVPLDSVIARKYSCEDGNS